jgi:hypothetical protein
MGLFRMILEENRDALIDEPTARQNCGDGLSKFDERFHVITTDGESVVNVRYRICTSTGEVFEGFTDSRGFTARIWTEFPADLTIELFES